MNPIDLLVWALLGGLAVIVFALFTAVAIIIIRAALKANVAPKAKTPAPVKAGK